MGEAKRRKAEIGALKSLGTAVDPASNDPEPIAEMARRLHALFETAKRDGTVDPAVNLLYAKLERTIHDIGPAPIACKKGCAHCCHVFVSTTAPELLFIAKLVRRRGDAVMARLQAAYAQTKHLGAEERLRHASPCPLLEHDACSIYDSRPKACRVAVSGDAAVCARVLRQLTNERIPTPTLYVDTANTYAVAMAIALKQSQLPHHAYELVAGLIRALEVADAERAWLDGDDIFSGVMRAPGDVLAGGSAQFMFRHAFGAGEAQPG
jgi:hypothetical protein